MPSKLIGADKAVAAQPLCWPRVGGSTENPRNAGAARDHNLAQQGGPEPDHVRVLIAQQQRIQELEGELASRPRQAYQQGYSEGQAAGAQQTASIVDPVAAKMAESIRELSSIRRRYLRQAEEDVLKLALAIARRVLHRELTVDRECLLGVVKAVLDRVDARDVHRVRLHPEDAPLVQRHLANSTGLTPCIEVAPDASLERGSVIVETSRGSLDGSISSQLAEIERGLADLVRRSA
jgi:flagellar assembly protein FliH